MKAAMRNVQLSVSIARFMQPLLQVINPAGIEIEKLTAIENRITAQLRYTDKLHVLFPNAGLRSHGDKHFYEHYDFGGRVVWEANNNEHQ
jgi:hypothetical protein